MVRNWFFRLESWDSDRYLLVISIWLVFEVMGGGGLGRLGSIGNRLRVDYLSFSICERW